MNPNNRPSHGGPAYTPARQVIDDEDCVCSACRSGSLDTGFECDDCGHDMMPEMMQKKASKKP